MASISRVTLRIVGALCVPVVEVEAEVAVVVVVVNVVGVEWCGDNSKPSRPKWKIAGRRNRHNGRMAMCGKK